MNHDMIDKWFLSLLSAAVLLWIIASLASGRFGTALILGGFVLFFTSIWIFDKVSKIKTKPKKPKPAPEPVKPEYEWPEAPKQLVLTPNGNREVKYLFPGSSLRFTDDFKLSTSKKLWSNDLVFKNNSKSDILTFEFDDTGKLAGVRVNE